MLNEVLGPSSFAGMLRQALGSRLAPDASDFITMMAPDGVMTFPFAPPGYVARVQGRPALARYLARVSQVLSIDRLTEPRTYPTLDPDVVILEFGCEGHGVKTALPYRQRYLSVITLDRGLISLYRDFWNPLTLVTAAGGLAALHAAMGEAQ